MRHRRNVDSRSDVSSTATPHSSLNSPLRLLLQGHRYRVRPLLIDVTVLDLSSSFPGAKTRRPAGTRRSAFALSLKGARHRARETRCFPVRTESTATTCLYPLSCDGMLLIGLRATLGSAADKRRSGSSKACSSRASPRSHKCGGMCRRRDRSADGCSLHTNHRYSELPHTYARSSSCRARDPFLRTGISGACRSHSRTRRTRQSRSRHTDSSRHTGP